MPTLSESSIAGLIEPYLSAPLPAGLTAALGAYLALLLRWNARTNLTAIRQPEEIVRRHFGESLFLATQLQELLPPDATLLDFGSGAGFPGIPLQLFLPRLRVTLAESQGKKAAFLREAVRTLHLATEVWQERVENIPGDRVFQCVALRAVDDMGIALQEARKRVGGGGLLAVLGGRSVAAALSGSSRVTVPESQSSFLYLLREPSAFRDLAAAVERRD